MACVPVLPKNPINSGPRPWDRKAVPTRFRAVEGNQAAIWYLRYSLWQLKVSAAKMGETPTVGENPVFCKRAEDLDPEDSVRTSYNRKRESEKDDGSCINGRKTMSEWRSRWN